MKSGERTVTGKTNYIGGIDGLRAIAVLLVLAYHLNLPFAKGGLLGVTVFFVISGFLITRILVEELNTTQRIDLKKFWIRRIRRLLPAVLVMVTVFILVSAVFNRVLFTKACSDLLSVIFGYNNWWQIGNQVSYFEHVGAPSPFTHCWSLAIETQFYLVYPLLLLLIAKLGKSRKWYVWSTGICAVLSLFAIGILFDPSSDPSRVYYGTDTRAFSLLFGALLALIPAEKVAKRYPRLCEGAGIFSFTLLLVLGVAVDGNSSFWYYGGQGLVSVLTVLVLLSVLRKDSLLGRSLQVAPVRWIGERSYGIYLWHYPLILLLGGGKKMDWWMAVIAGALTVTIAALSYRYVESPIRRGIIGVWLKVLRDHPRTRMGQRRKRRMMKQSLRVVIAAGVVCVSALTCIAVVPREHVVSNVEKLERQAEEAKKLAHEKSRQISQNQKNELQGKSEEEILSNIQLLLLGDSIALGATDAFYATFPSGISDAAVSRQAYESLELYDEYTGQKGWDGDGVIFALGANGVLSDSLSLLREKMGPDKLLFILTVNAPYVNWETSNNDAVRQFVKENKNTYLVDWKQVCEGHAEYFEQDETHLKPEGANAYVQCIKEAVLDACKKEK